MPARNSSRMSRTTCSGRPHRERPCDKQLHILARKADHDYLADLSNLFGCHRHTGVMAARFENNIDADTIREFGDDRIQVLVLRVNCLDTKSSTSGRRYSVSRSSPEMITFAPIEPATTAVRTPIGPGPLTKTVSPDVTTDCSKTARVAMLVGSVIAACSNETLWGTVCTCTGSTTTYSA